VALPWIESSRRPRPTEFPAFREKAGNSAFFARFQPEKGKPIQRLARKFPARPSREFFALEQGNSREFFRESRELAARRNEETLRSAIHWNFMSPHGRVQRNPKDAQFLQNRPDSFSCKGTAPTEKKTSSSS